MSDPFVVIMNNKISLNQGRTLFLNFGTHRVLFLSHAYFSLTGKCKTRKLKSNREITETDKIDALSAHIHDCSLF